MVVKESKLKYRYSKRMFKIKIYLLILSLNKQNCEINKMNIEQEVCDLYELLNVLCSMPKTKLFQINSFNPNVFKLIAKSC